MATLSINDFFNEIMRVRIVGTHEDPVFYAKEIGNVLGIKQVNTSMNGFKPRDFVSYDECIRRGIRLTKIMKRTGNERAVDPKKPPIMLSERGVYKLIFQSRKACAEEFREYIVDLLHDIRLAESKRLIMVIERTAVALAEYERRTPVIYVFRCKRPADTNPYTLILPDEREPGTGDDINIDLFSGEYLYKCTTKPRTEDYKAFSLHAKILYKHSEFIHGLDDEPELGISEKAFEYCAYYVEDEEWDFGYDVEVTYVI